MTVRRSGDRVSEGHPLCAIDSSIPEVASHTDGEAARARDVFRAMTLTDVASIFMEVIARIISAWQNPGGRHGRNRVVQAHPNRSTCSETGEVDLSAAERGKRLNVLAALRATG